MEQDLEIGDIVLCTVDKIVGTTVFVKIEERTKQKEGSIIISEVATGRIRNLRDYVVPKKTIVCKVLRLAGENVELSLRRVSQKETKDKLEEFKQERTYKNILKSILQEKAENIFEKIQEKQTITEFIKEAKQDKNKLESLVGKQDSEKIIEIISAQKEKTIELKKIFALKSNSSKGIEEIKEILKIKDANIKYISAGKYSIKTQASDLKKADKILEEKLKEIQEKAKQKSAEFEILKIN